MHIDCGSKNGCFKSLPMVSLLRHRDVSDVSARLKVFSCKAVSRFGLARWGERCEIEMVFLMDFDYQLLGKTCRCLFFSHFCIGFTTDLDAPCSDITF